MRRLVCVALFSLLAVPCAFAQTQETINVHVVEVPVTVVGSDGNPVRGLTAKNFEVYDGREKRAITGFDAVDFASKQAMSAISPMNPVARRNFLILFDLTFSSPKGLARAQEAARDFLTKELQPRDVAAVGTLDVEKGFNLLTTFTTDRSLLMAAIATPRNFLSDDPLRLAAKSMTVEDVTRANAGGGGTLEGFAKRRGMDATDMPTAATEFAAVAANSARQDDQYMRGRIEQQMNVLGNLAETLRAVKGRKQIVLLSEGFDPRMVIGRDAQDTNATGQENVAVSRGNVAGFDADARYGSHTSLSLLDQMAKFFRGSDVVLHAIDIQGVRVQNDARSGAMINSSNSLDLLSRPTGGQVFKQSNSLSGDFERMLHSQEVVYVLAFQALSNGNGKFHDLKVKLVDVPGSARVFARAGYYDLGSRNAMERTLTNAEIVMNDIAQPDVPVTAWSAPFPTSSTLAQVPVILEINGAGLLKGAKGNAAEVQIYVYAFDEAGLVRDRLYEKISLDLSKVGAKLKAGGINYYGTLALPPGAYAVKSLVRAGEADIRGFVRTSVVVPNGQQLALGAPVFVQEGTPSWVMVKGISHDKGNAYPFELGGDTFVPTTRATTDSRKFTVLVWNAKPDELSWQTNPSAKFLGHLQSGSATKLVFQLDKIDPSAAMLDVTVQKKGATDAMKTSVAIQR